MGRDSENWNVVGMLSDWLISRLLAPWVGEFTNRKPRNQAPSAQEVVAEPDRVSVPPSMLPPSYVQ